MGVFSVDLDKINLDDDKNFDKDHPETTVHFRLLAWSNKFEKCKALKKDIRKELMPQAWHSTRSEKGTEPIFTEKVGRQ